MRTPKTLATLVALLALALLPSTAHAQWKAENGVLIRGTIVTMDDTKTVVEGALYVKDGVVADILPANARCPDGAIEIDTHGGFVFPGLMNLHNHVAYNFLPLYPSPAKYTNRDQWPKGKSYEALVNNPKNLLTMPGHWDLQTEVLKYAEIKALMGGETTIQGSPTDSGSSTILVRNTESKNFTGHKTGEDVLGVDTRLATDAQRAKWNADDGVFIHLAEGIDAHAEKEYKAWKDIFGSAFPKLIGIHCAGLTEADWKDWEATTGQPKVVWSPLSNLMLYGQTTNIPAALAHRALVALGTDWSPSGSKSLIWELKVADQVNRTKWKSVMSDYDLVSLVTRNPAKMIGWGDKVGKIQKGMVADLIVVDGSASRTSPYRNLIEGVESNVQLVLVGGDPIYGDEPILAKLKKDEKGNPHYEVLKESPGGRPKALDLARDVPKGDETVAEIEQMLSDAAKLDPAALAAVLNKGTDAKGPDQWKPRADMRKWLASHKGHPLPATSEATADEVKEYLHLRYPNSKPVTIDPIYEQDDDAYWTALAANVFLKDPAVLDVAALEAYRPAPPSRSIGLTGALDGARATSPQDSRDGR